MRNLLTSTVGADEEYLWEHRTEPVVIAVPVDRILTELGIADLYEDSARDLWGQQEAVSDDLTDQEAEIEYDRLAHLEEALEALREAEWAAYGEAFRATVLAELEREPIPGLRVPVEFAIDARPLRTHPIHEQPIAGPLARLYDAGWENTPLPGSGIAPKDYPSGEEIASVERAAGRLPHLRIPTTLEAIEASDPNGGTGAAGGRGGEWR